MTLKGVTNMNANSLLGINRYETFARVEMNDVYLEKADTTEVTIIVVLTTPEIVINNVTINNNDISNTDPTGIIYISPSNNGTAKFSNITVMNSDIAAKRVIEYVQEGTGYITIENLYTKNVTLGTDARIISAQSSTRFYLKNSTFIEVKPRDLGDSTAKLIALPSIELSDNLDSAIEDSYIENSQVGLIELLGLKNSESLSSNFMLTNITYANSYLEFPHDLISFTGIETSNNFQISLSDITMRNITFQRTGTLINLRHQTETLLTMNNASFENIVGGQISIKSTNLQNSELKTKVNMTNISATSISGNSKSLIYIEEGGELYIYNSDFNSIDNTERGAVLNTGLRNSYIEVHNSTFENNLSIYGSVANVQDSGVIKFYDSNITDNFAIQSGAIQASSDGRFEFYR